MDRSPVQQHHSLTFMPCRKFSYLQYHIHLSVKSLHLVLGFTKEVWQTKGMADVMADVKTLYEGGNDHDDIYTQTIIQIKVQACLTCYCEIFHAEDRLQ